MALRSPSGGGRSKHCEDCTCLSAALKVTQEHEGMSYKCCAQEIDVAQSQELLLNPVYHGWEKYKRVMGRVIFFCKLLKHKVLHHNHEKSVSDCIICKIKNPSSIDVFSPAWKSIRDHEVLMHCARKEAVFIDEEVKPKKLHKYSKIDGVYYEVSRFAGGATLVQKDLPFSVFFDEIKIPSAVPVI